MFWRMEYPEAEMIIRLRIPQPQIKLGILLKTIVNVFYGCSLLGAEVIRNNVREEATVNIIKIKRNG